MISIIIPTLQEEKYLENTLKSLKTKLTLPHEIIVSDGKSTDRTVEIAKKYADKVLEYSGIERQTIAQGRNAGAKAATGDYLVFIDADCDIQNPDEFFNFAINKFNNDYKIVALTSRLIVGKKWSTFADTFFSNVLSFAYMIINNFLQIGIAWGEFEMIRKDAFFKINAYKEHLTSGEDGDLFNRLSKIGKTRLYWNMTVTHTGRRVHKLGWPYLLSIWWMNALWLKIKNKSIVKEWKVIR